MTNEEAINHGKEQLEIFGGEHREFIEMAIKALEQLSSSEKPNKSETKIDCDNEDCNNCVNHKYCDYEPNKSEILTGSKSEDCISREDVMHILDYVADTVSELPPVTPSYNSIKTELKPCNDCISREAVKEMLTAEWTKYMPIESDVNLSFVLEKISELPSVTPKAKTGHWSRKTKVDAYDIAGVKTWGVKCQCDRCDFTTIVVEDFGYYKYCPNCGAKMEVE